MLRHVVLLVVLVCPFSRSVSQGSRDSALVIANVNRAFTRSTDQAST
jgi:hypothetical protein